MAGNPTKPGPGRPKGSPNKITSIAKDVIAEAAEGLGGAKGLLTWAKADDKNTAIFWGTIYPKLLPHQITGLDGQALVVNVVRLLSEDGK